MIERLTGRDMMLHGGKHHGDVRSMADHYDGIDDTPDGAIIDKIISGIDPKPAAEAHPDERHNNASDLARRALFFADKDMRSESIQASIRQHPSAQNIPSQQLSARAAMIIQGYHEELEQFEQHKNRVTASEAAHDLFVAAIRNLGHLSVYDRTVIAKMLGHDENYFVKDATAASIQEATPPRGLDWRELQANDDTLRGE